MQFMLKSSVDIIYIILCNYTCKKYIIFYGLYKWVIYN